LQYGKNTPTKSFIGDCTTTLLMAIIYTVM